MEKVCHQDGERDIYIYSPNLICPGFQHCFLFWSCYMNASVQFLWFFHLYYDWFTSNEALKRPSLVQCCEPNHVPRSYRLDNLAVRSFSQPAKSSHRLTNKPSHTHSGKLLRTISDLASGEMTLPYLASKT